MRIEGEWWGGGRGGEAMLCEMSLGNFFFFNDDDLSPLRCFRDKICVSASVFFLPFSIKYVT
jgi:hypothetical protein